MRSSILWLGAAEVSSRLGALVVLSISARALAVEEFSAYVLFLTIASLLWVFAQLGTTMHGIAAICNVGIRRKASLIVGITIIRVFFGGVVSFLFWVVSKHLIPNISDTLVLLAISYVIVKALSIDWVLRALDFSKYWAVLLTISSLVNVSVAIGLTLLTNSAEALAFAFLLAATVVMVGAWLRVVMTYYNRKFSSVKLDVCEIKSHLMASLKIGAAGVAVMTAQSLPLLALNWYSSKETVAIFGGIQRILQIGLAPMSVLSLAHYPQLVRVGSDSVRARESYYSDLMLSAVWIAVGIGLGAEQVVGVVLGAGFISGVYYAPYVAVLVPLYYFRTANSDLAIALGSTRLVLYGCLAGFALVFCFVAAVLPGAEFGWQVTYSIVALGLGEGAVLVAAYIAVLKMKLPVRTEGTDILDYKGVMLVMCAIVAGLLIHPHGFFVEWGRFVAILVLLLIFSAKLYRNTSIFNKIRPER